MTARDWLLSAVVVALLGTATAVGQIVQRQPHLSLNTAALNDSQRTELFDRLERELQLPCCDPLQTGVGRIVDRLVSL